MCATIRAEPTVTTTNLESTEPTQLGEQLESPFPESPRVIYSKNPLEQVVCQIRFPAILRISTELPSRFQEAIRGIYPVFRQVNSIAPPADLPAELGALISNFAPSQTAYEFTSADGNWTATLAADFVALTTNSYRRWAEFKERVVVLLATLTSEYDPPFTTRIGLRYRDAICPSSMGLFSTDWRDLLAAHVLGEIEEPAVGAVAEEASRILTLRLPEGRVRVRHGIGERTETGESCYVIDSDFFIEDRKELSDVVPTLDRFNRHARRLFRWFITDGLHEALGPEPV